MRNRAKPSPSVTPTTAPAPAEPEPELEPKKRTKYDELVDVLADGLFDMIFASKSDAERQRP